MRAIRLLLAVLLAAAPSGYLGAEVPSASERGAFDGAVAAYGEADYATAFELFSAVARLGHAEAQFNLGAMYANGDGVQPDLATAYAWLRLAAENGHDGAIDLTAQIEGMVEQPQLDAAWEGISEYWPEALEASLLPDVVAELAEGREIVGAPGRETNEAMPIRRIPPEFPREAAMSGLAGEVNLEFTITAEGDVTNVEVISSSDSIFNRPAIRAVQQWKFEPKRIDGVAVPRPARQRINFGFSESGSRYSSDQRIAALLPYAEAGDAQAQWALAVELEDRSDLLDDDLSILDLHLRSAQSGFAPAQLEIAEMLSRGDGCAIDQTKAERWARLSAEAGYAPAMTTLATWARHAEEPDDEAAIRWLRGAVGSDDLQAQYYLASLLLIDDGSPEAVTEAVAILDRMEDELPTDDPMFHELRAYAHAKRGEWRDATRAENRALRFARQMGYERSAMNERLDLYRDEQLPAGNWIF